MYRLDETLTRRPSRDSNRLSKRKASSRRSRVCHLKDVVTAGMASCKVRQVVPLSATRKPATFSAQARHWMLHQIWTANPAPCS